MASSTWARSSPGPTGRRTSPSASHCHPGGMACSRRRRRPTAPRRGAGPFGLHWSVGMPGVARETSRGNSPLRRRQRQINPLRRQPRALGADVAGTTTRSRPPTEALFAVMRRHRGAIEATAWRRAATMASSSRYGTPPPRNASDNWREPARVSTSSLAVTGSRRRHLL